MAFVLNIASSRMLAPAGRGELALLLQIGYLASLGLLLGTDRSVVAAFSGAPAPAVARAFGRLLRAPSGVCVLVAVGAFAAPLAGLPTWGAGLGIALLFAVVNAFVRAVRSVAIAADRRREFLAYTLTGEVFRLAVTAVLLATGSDHVVTWLATYVLVGAVPTLVWWFRWTRGPGSASAPEATARARTEGLVLLPSALAHSGMLRLDRFLLAGLASTAALGLYAGVATMTEVLAWPLLAFADSRLGRWRADADAGRLRLRPLVLGIAAYAVAAGAVVGGAVALVLVPLLGPEFAPAGALVWPLVAAAMVFGVSQIAITLLIAHRRSSAASVVEVVGFAVSVVAFVVLIGPYGAAGAAYGSLLGYLGCLVVALVVLARVRAATRRAP
ncbi:lipopolysaccharide biosynthesis protein [Pseudonocardia sp. McavD-2-B]|uniref:lipopolysaccharide biosynthesis protein n=1 Tax=Pseudonocardia sp. McavD-2-B TaxID=2954499 RepID=UPI002096D45D|nr:hypothetical protein [Pseudonocardia sp. McavD-2-B]MCO7193202.1 hypothetical protein [Pseudonocardia sp. McavD-2-B]